MEFSEALAKERNRRKKEKQRKLPFAALRLVPSPRYFANSISKISNNAFLYGTCPANAAWVFWKIPRPGAA